MCLCSLSLSCPKARAPRPLGAAPPELALTRVAGAGSRKVVSALGKSALLFWYRDALYATEPRSPAEGAYSQGFLTARFTQARTRTRSRTRTRTLLYAPLQLTGALSRR